MARDGAGEGNRTLVVSLGSFCSTIELHPHFRRFSRLWTPAFCKAFCSARAIQAVSKCHDDPHPVNIDLTNVGYAVRHPGEYVGRFLIGEAAKDEVRCKGATAIMKMLRTTVFVSDLRALHDLGYALAETVTRPRLTGGGNEHRLDPFFLGLVRSSSRNILSSL